MSLEAFLVHDGVLGNKCGGGGGGAVSRNSQKAVYFFPPPPPRLESPRKLFMFAVFA